MATKLEIKRELIENLEVELKVTQTRLEFFPPEIEIFKQDDWEVQIRELNTLKRKRLNLKYKIDNLKNGAPMLGEPEYDLNVVMAQQKNAYMSRQSYFD